MIRAILVDFDGVLVDTDRSTINFYNSLLKEKRLAIQEEDFPKKVGRKSFDFLSEVLREKLTGSEIMQLVTKKRESFTRDLEKHVSPIDVGVRMVRDLKEAGFLLALVTGNQRDFVLRNLNHLGIHSLFSSIVCWEDVVQKKPHPETYFTACTQLCIAPEETVVIEDSTMGIAAAKNGGFRVITFRTPFNEDGQKKADIVAEGLAEVTECIRRLSASAR